MLIDFHVHILPEKIADKAFGAMQEKVRTVSKIDQPLYYRGTYEALKEKLAASKVDLCVPMPIATGISQSQSINRFAKDISDGERIISFASVHPQQPDAIETLKEIKALGFIGIKLHPDYQLTFVDDEKFIRLVKTAGELGLHTTIHAGFDAGIAPPNRGTVDRMRVLLDKTDASTVTLAHMGGFKQWDEVEQYLVGTKAYFDTSVVSRFMDIEQYRRIIIKHGADRILFGSDLPWEDPADTLAFLKNAGLSDEETELITHKNAEKLLGL